MPPNAEVEVDVVSKDPVEINRAPLEVENTRAVFDEDGTIYLTGELVNSTDHPVRLDNLAGAVFEAGGHILSAAYADVFLTYYAPQERGPFRVSLHVPLALAEAMEDFRLYPDAQRVAEQPLWEILFTETHAFTDVQGVTHLVGEITNVDPGSPMGGLQPRLIGAFYAADDTVLDAAYLDFPFPLDREVAAPYDLDGWEVLNHLPATVDQIADSSVQPDPGQTQGAAVPLVPLTFTLDSVTYDQGQATVVGSVRNDTDQAIAAVQVLIGLRDEEEQCVAAGTFTSSQSLAPGDRVEVTLTLALDESIHPDILTAFAVARGTSP